jgi:hypothetical protein
MSWAPLRHGRPRAAGNSSPTTSRICASDCWGATQTRPCRAGGVIERRRIRVGASLGVRCVRVSLATSGWSRRRLWQQPRQLNLSQHAHTAANCSRGRCDECPTRQGETRHAPTRAYWLCCLVIGWVGVQVTSSAPICWSHRPSAGRMSRRWALGACRSHRSVRSNRGLNQIQDSA